MTSKGKGNDKNSKNFQETQNEYVLQISSAFVKTVSVTLQLETRKVSDKV